MSQQDGGPRNLDYVGDQSDLQATFDELQRVTTAQQRRKQRAADYDDDFDDDYDDDEVPRIIAEQVDPMNGKFTREKVLFKQHLSNDTIRKICDAYAAVSELMNQA